MEAKGSQTASWDRLRCGALPAIRSATYSYRSSPFTQAIPCTLQKKKARQLTALYLGFISFIAFSLYVNAGKRFASSARGKIMHNILIKYGPIWWVYVEAMARQCKHQQMNKDWHNQVGWI